MNAASASRMDATTSTIRRSRAETHAAAGEPGLADTHWRAVLEEDPSDTEAAIHVAAFALMSGFPRNALVYVCLAIRHGRSDAETLRLAYRCCIALEGNRPDEGASDEVPEGRMIDHLVACSAAETEEILWPEARRLLLRLVETLSMERKGSSWPEGAETGDNPPLQDGQAVQELAGRVEAAFEGREQDEETAATLSALRLDHAAHAAWFRLGWSLLRTGHAALARDVFALCSELVPESISYRLYLGRALSANAEYDLAYSVFDELRNMPSRSKTDEYHLAEAEAAKRSMITRLILMTRDAVNDGDVARAWSIYELIRHHPVVQGDPSVEARILKASLDQVLEAHREGRGDVLPLAAAHLDREPDNIAAQQIIGMALMAEGRFVEAVPYWESQAEQLPDNALAHLQLAKCLERAGQKVRARESARVALELDPDLKSASIIYSRLTPGDGEG